MNEALSAHELGHFLDIARRAANEAATLLTRAFRSRPHITKKGSIDLVTEFDLQSEALIRKVLGDALPSHQIIGEEGALQQINNDFVWYVDPIDGTTNFAHGHPCFAVSIGLAYRNDPVVGVVNAPALQTEWHAARGLGAFRNGVACNVSEADVLDDSLLATGFPYDVRTSNDNNFREFFAVKDKAQGIRRCGAAAIDLAWVADGAFDAYWEQKLKPWDIAAAIVLIREAGGLVSGYPRHEKDWKDGYIIASNGRVHDELVNLIDQTRQSANLP